MSESMRGHLKMRLFMKKKENVMDSNLLEFIGTIGVISISSFIILLLDKEEEDEDLTKNERKRRN